MTDAINEECPVCNPTKRAKEQFATAKVAEHIKEKARRNETHRAWIDQHTTNGTLSEIREALTDHGRPPSVGMDDETESAAGFQSTLRPFLRIGIGGLLLGPGASKLLTHGQSAQFFRTLALPAPEVLVVLVGAVEISIATSLLLDWKPRVGAVLTVPVVIVAVGTAGPTWQNLSVLLAALTPIGIDTKTRRDFTTGSAT